MGLSSTTAVQRESGAFARAGKLRTQADRGGDRGARAENCTKCGRSGGGGRVERGNMGLNKLEIFALCLVHIWIGEQICIIHLCKLFGLMN